LTSIPHKLENLNIIPIVPDSKKPACEWKLYQTAKCPLEFVEKHDGNFAVVCGKISNNLVVVDVDSQPLYDRFLRDVETLTIRTPSGGSHLYFFDKRVEQKIPKFGGYPIDVQGDGSFVLIPPSTINDRGYGIVKDLEIMEVDVVGLLKGRLPIKEQPADIEAFKKHIDISEVIQRYVIPAYLGRGYFQALCPFHDEREPSFTVYKASYYCFGCGVHGDIIDFVMEREHLGFKDAVEWLSREYGVPSPFKSGVKRGLFDEEGKPDPEFCVKGLMDDYGLVTTYDNEEVFWYHNGVYCEGAETRVKEWIELRFKEAGKPAKQSFVSEIIEAVKRRSYVERSEFNPRGKLCLVNGVLDLETFKLESHSPKLLFTYQLPVEYNPSADCPRFKQFCKEVLKPEDISMVQEIAGYCLRLGNELQTAFICWGTGANGKSVMLKVITASLGKQNVSSEPLQDLCSKTFSPAQLWGKLANICADIPPKPVKYVGKFKELTGEDQTKGERKFKNPFYFDNGAKLIFSCNELPEVDDASLAFWRRWIVIEFPNCFEGREDRRLMEKLGLERPGILNWALEGYRRLWQRGDFELTTSAKEVGETWKKRANSLYWFVTERVERSPIVVVPKDEFYSCYVEFCAEHDVEAKTKNIIGQELPRLCGARAVQRTINGKLTWCWAGIQLRGSQPSQLSQPKLGDFEKTENIREPLKKPCETRETCELPSLSRKSELVEVRFLRDINTRDISLPNQPIFERVLGSDKQFKPGDVIELDLEDVKILAGLGVVAEMISDE
jgi:P4 family phage/plasmid primase-like protien